VAPGSNEFTPGASVALTATPASGYRFVIWSVGGDAGVAPVNAATTTLTIPVTSPSSVMATFVPDFPGGTGTPGDPHTISNLAELKRMNNCRSSYFKLIASIDLISETNWLPIGDDATKFTGGFDGDVHTLNNLTINSGIGDRGLFGAVEGAVIKNVTLTGVNITTATGNYAGGLVGRSLGATSITDCDVTGTINGYQGIGGLLGCNDDGGMVTILRCWTNVAISTNTYGVNGGLVGTTKGGAITKSFALGSVSFSAGTPSAMGGLVGMLRDTSITDSYARGNVSGNQNVGGLVGYMDLSSVVLRCYSTGLVNATLPATAGGLVGVNSGATVTDSYYDMNTSNQSDSLSKGQPLITGDMISAATHATIYSGWDFATIWNAFTDGAYPTLRP